MPNGDSHDVLFLCIHYEHTIPAKCIDLKIILTSLLPILWELRKTYEEVYRNNSISTFPDTYRYSGFECKEWREFMSHWLKPLIHGEVVHPPPTTEQLLHCLRVHITAKCSKFLLPKKFRNKWPSEELQININLRISCQKLTSSCIL